VRQAGQALAEQVGRHEAGAGGVPGAGGVLEDRGQREGGRVMKVYLLLYHPDHEQRYPVPVGVSLSRAGAAAAPAGAWLVFAGYSRIRDHPCPALGCFVLTRHGVPPTYDGDDTRLANLVSGDHEVEGHDGDQACYLVYDLDLEVAGETDPVRLAALAALDGDP